MILDTNRATGKLCTMERRRVRRKKEKTLMDRYEMKREIDNSQKGKKEFGGQMYA